MIAAMPARFTNPFRYGDLALDEAFTDRDDEIAELNADIRNGQNVVIFAPRRFGKSSLVWRASQELLARKEVLIAKVDLMATPSKEKLADKLAKSIYEDIATVVFRARQKATSIFTGLQITPRISLDPIDGSLSFTFEASSRKEDIDATLEKLFELPAHLSADRKERCALVIDEFQEILDIDPRLLPLMRSVFQRQPEVAHVYLGSKRSMMERIFNDFNEPFWRSAKKIELGLIDPRHFAPFIEKRFDSTDRGIDDVVDRVLEITRGHPYGTQELCYFLWEEVSEGRIAHAAELETALTKVLRSENAHFTRIWTKAAKSHRLVLQALADEPVEHISDEYRRKHGLPIDATVRKALKVLIDDEIVVRDANGYRIGEPFLAEWIRRYSS
jgi:uncharacterized protein